MRLKDKVAVVTGASSGVGREIALLFANIAIFTFTKLTFKKLKPDTSLFSKIVCFIAILLIFFNKATYEFFYYAESGVMWLGILLTVLAIKVFLKDNSFNI